MRSTTILLIAAGVIAAASIPLILKIVPRNPVYGFRTPSTLSSDELWFRANHFAGWALLVGAVVGAALLVVLPEVVGLGPGYCVAVLVLPLAVAVTVSFIYIRAIHRQ